MVKVKMPLYALILLGLGGSYGAVKIFEHVRKKSHPALPPGSATIPPYHVWGSIAHNTKAKVLNFIHATNDPHKLRTLADGLNQQGAIGAAAAAHAKANALDSKSGAFINALQQHLPSHAATVDAMRNAPPPVTPAAAVHTTSSHPDVRTRVINFQKSKGLSPDGIVGPMTWAALTGTPKVANMSAVKKAIVSYQMSKGLSPDGVVGNDTLNALGVA